MQELFLRLAEMPVLQVAIIMGATFFTEDATLLATGLLVGSGRLPFVTGFAGLWLGIAGGDSLLYFLGRTLGPRVRRWGLVSDDRLARAASFFDRHGVGVVLAARCLPGSRTPTYLAAGILKAPARAFVLTVLAGALLWAAGSLYAVSRLGGAVLERLHGLQWTLLGAVAVLGLIVLLVRRLSRPGVAVPVPDEA